MDRIRPALIACLCLAGASPRLRASGDFYDEPLPTLSALLRSEQLPAKSVGDLVRKPAAQAPEKPVDFQAEIAALATQPAAQAQAAVARLLIAARAEQPVIGPGMANLLHDLRDLYAAGQATPEETTAYINWRLAHTAAFAISWGQAERRAAWDRPDPLDETLKREFERQTAAASPALKPHWLYLRGAATFKSGDDLDSEKWFQKVLAEFPAHPRAEAALFMVARCLLSQSRDASDNATTVPGFRYRTRPEVLARAKKAFEAYLAQYPQGRFAGDALGWLGAAAYDAQDYVTAARLYLQQLELPGRPELAEPASDMCEKVLSHLASAPDDAKFNELARTPAAALGLVYLVLNSSEADNFNGDADAPEAVREWRRSVLPRLARAITANEALYQDVQWRPRYLALLAMATSGAGRNDDALRLTELAGEAKSDDLLFARGLTLQRARRSKEAAAAYGDLLTVFPQSPLAAEARLRMGFALFDDHRAGEALVDILKAAPPLERYYPGYPQPILTTLEPGHFHQLADAIMNFAPVPELIAGADTPGLAPEQLQQLREVIAQRLLAREDFEEARKFMAPGQWALAAEKLAQLTRDARAAATPAEKAAAALALGDAWAAARGKLLTAPLDTEKGRSDLFAGQSANAGLRRVENAQALNAAGNYQLDLENRDELRHAFNWWLEASDAQPKTPLAAKALWRALQAMPAIADVSAFHYQRAVAKKWGAISRKLYDRLKKEHPASEEALTLAVYWDFPPPQEADPERDSMMGTYAGTTTARGSRVEQGSWRGFAGEEEEGGGRGDKDADALTEQILGLEKLAATAEPAAFKKAVENLQRKAHRTLTSDTAASWVNYLDDLALFAGEPDPGREVRARYVKLRTRTMRLATFGYWPVLDNGRAAGAEAEDSDPVLRADVVKAQADPKMAKAADYLAFLECAVVANHIVDMPFPGVDKDGGSYTYRSRNYAELEKLTRAFLEKFPKSKKREAALLLHAKALHFGMKPEIYDPGAAWPEAPRWEGGSGPVTTTQIPFDAARLKAALDQYEKEFPKGRYVPEIRDFRGALAERTGQWKVALETTLAQLEDAGRPSLQFAAATRLEGIFNRLPNTHDRPALLGAIRANARARARLKEMIAQGGGEAMFVYLSPWLGEQLGGD